MNRKVRFCLLAAIMILGLFGSVQAISAAEDTVAEAAPAVKTGWQKSGKYWFYYSSKGKMYTGWRTINGKLYYLRKKEDESGPKGSRVTGLYQIGDKTYYFSGKGVLLTGWQTINNSSYYFATEGKAGTIGAMYTGLRVIDGGRYFFKSDGQMVTGWYKYKKCSYFFCRVGKAGVKGKAYTGWRTIGGKRYYFNSKGVMQTGHWINKKYYVGSDGVMLKSCVTPDGYIVNFKGEKQKLANGWIKKSGKYYYYVSGKKVTGWKTINGKKYYFDANGVRQTGWLVKTYTYYLKNGVMQTGWQTIGGKRYYFMKNGRMAVNTTVDGVKIGADGVAEKKKTSVLLIAGHGQGDVGACGKYTNTVLYEYKYTRQFSTLIRTELEKTGADISVTMYDQNYDCYQVLSGKKTGPVPNLKSYDYVLEIHFNATVESSKDPKGDGICKGIGMYINSAKSDISVDKAIIQAVNKQTGFRIWGGGTGIMRSATLFNAKTCQAEGVSYGLLETAFIDDRDDMKFYSANKEKMAKAVASAIVSSLGAK
ncbi:MAG: N-acetylmuramoyl-L-alanine amidase [Candidatus Choladocola sp.]|nr:N-acetylmuramoyl-L-alanine amidase [Candidatus Choladocola sp.]